MSFDRPNTPLPADGSGATAMTAPPPPSSRRWSPRSARDSLQPTSAPEPPPRRPRGGGFLGKLSAFLTLLVFLAAAAAGVAIYGQSVVNAPGPLQQDKVVFIPRGSGASEIAAILEQNGVISSATAFETYQIAQSVLSGGQSSLRAGEYEFKQQASLKAVRETLVSGRPVQHRISIPEGLTSEQIVQRLRENDVLEGEIRNIPREGALLPDTYPFERGTSRERLLARMESEQRRVLQEIWARRSAEIPLKSAAELVILASIVEKETGRSDERTRVASVFINRLNRGMRLESDPTIIYGLVGGKGTLGRGILATEIRQPTPYNTYVITGLPPGPIANPGRAAMEATANPSRTRDLFFVADGTGGHAFAETYEQHQRNVARWRQIEGGQGGAPPVAAPPQPVPPAAAPAPGQRPRQQRSDAAPPAAAGAQPPQQSVAAGSQVPAAQPQQPAAPPSPFHIPQADLSFMSPPQASAGGGIAAGFGDERQLPAASGDIESYPVAPGRRQEMQRNAVQAGAPRSAGLPADSAAAFAPPPPEAAAPQQRRPRAFDASEGTARDPLRNKSFDLNSPKTVPALR
jgi:UPF0755 protein